MKLLFISHENKAAIAEKLLSPILGVSS